MPPTSSILPVFDSGEADGLLYYTMPLVEGESLRDRLERDGALPLEEALQIARDVGEALAHALLSLIPDAGRLGVTALVGRGHEAIQPFARAEREFYYGRYRQAFEHYTEAVEADSTFALAAVKGAQSASWMHNQTAASEMVAVAIAHVDALPPLWASFARGFHAFLSGCADSAVYHFEQAVDLDEKWPEGWMGLGETYQHYLPRRTPQDSLANDAFQKVFALTDGYAPAIYHVTEHAIRARDITGAATLLEEYRSVRPDSAVLGNLELALSCSRESPDGVDWRQQMLEDVNRVYQAGKLLGVAGAHPACAIAALLSVLRYETPATRAWSYSAMVGLQSMLVATGRTQELRSLLDSAAATGSLSGAAARLHYILDALAGADVESEATAVVNSLRGTIDTLGSTQLWYLGLWDAYRGDVSLTATVRELLLTRAEAGEREAALMAASLSGHIAVVSGDTAAALRSLQELTPTAPHYSYLLRAFESLGYERLIQARLLLAQGRFVEAHDVVEEFDAPGAASLIFSVFLPASLELRLDAALALGDGNEARRMRERLTVLGREDILDAQRP